MNSKQRRKERRRFKYKVTISNIPTGNEYILLSKWCEANLAGEVKDNYARTFLFTDEKDAMYFRLNY